VNETAIRDQHWRLLASGAVTAFMIAIIFLTLTKLSSSLHHMLWGIPVIAVSLLDIYFLTRSLLQQPKKIDTRLSSMLIGLGTTFGFSAIVMFLSASGDGRGDMAEIRQIGVVLSVLPYPLVVWALFCLGDCLTVVPEAHAVVAHGPYKYSRHPLYVCYMIWAVADVMMFPTWPMLIASISQIAFLMLRLRREEKLLLQTFPEYTYYYERTGLIGSRLYKTNFSNGL
jgi:isoprenylcysteine carboxyl methyltransferase (ICMT) family protein YpbQ